MIKGDSYKERCTHQLDEWVKGNPIHNDTDDECCPDFSCCKPDYLQPLEIRETFLAVCAKADEEEFNPDCHPFNDAKMGMLMSFLGGLVSSEFPDKNINIIDGETEMTKDLN